MSLLLERRPDGVAIVRLDRPERRNALDSPTLATFTETLRDLAADGELRALVLSTTHPRAFCAGADTEETLDREGGELRMRAFGQLYAALAAMPVPSVCVCVGNTLGAGAEIAAGADLRVGGENLELGWIGARLGVPVGPARLVGLVGLARAKELIFTGRRLDADAAEALGLLTRRAPEGMAEALALELAGRIAALPADGVRRLKGLFSALEDEGGRVARENAVLEDWQAHGTGLPSGGR